MQNMSNVFSANEIKELRKEDGSAVSLEYLPFVVDESQNVWQLPVMGTASRFASLAIGNTVRESSFTADCHAQSKYAARI